MEISSVTYDPKTKTVTVLERSTKKHEISYRASLGFGSLDYDTLTTSLIAGLTLKAIKFGINATNTTCIDRCARIINYSSELGSFLCIFAGVHYLLHGCFNGSSIHLSVNLKK